VSDRELQRLINERIEAFVADITRLAREHAVRTLTEALDVPAAPRDTDGGRRHKRSPDELERLGDEIVDHISANPGQNMQEIAAHFGATPKELSLPVKRLKEAGRLRTEGQRRATRYFAQRKRR
jgi:hypothetical protein